jgi:plastocyanin
MGVGSTWSHTFTTAGTYPYYCMIHPMMTGTIVVIQ